MIDLRSLRYSILVADHKSFRKAALAIGVGQSVLSRRIRSLEDTIGVSIFERHSGGVNLTYAGTEFVHAIRRALQEIDVAISTAETAGRGGVGRLAVGFYTSLSTGELRDVLLEYIRRFPEIAIKTVEASHDRLAAGLRSKAIDVIIVTSASGLSFGEDSLPLWNERIMIALSESHLLAGHEVVFWKDLRREQCLLMRRDPGPELYEHIITKFRSFNDRPDIVQHDISPESLLNLVGAGKGVALLYEGATGVVYPGVVYRELRDVNGPTRVAYIANWNQSSDNPALRRFLSLLRERYSVRSSLGTKTGCV